jgi:TnpA family transposase
LLIDRLDVDHVALAEGQSPSLMKNRSAIQPDTLHADTQGQSEPVFGLCRMLGIKLMPRMRDLSDAVFYRPTKSVLYRHIDALFGGEIDWDLIAMHARDMIQVVPSIQAAVVMPSMLLRKLATYNRRSRLYRAFRELGRVERTLFLLRFISSVEIRRTIRAETTKIEAYNDFLDWISFGGLVIKSGDPVEQEKQLKYASLVANAIILSKTRRKPKTSSTSPLRALKSRRAKNCASRYHKKTSTCRRGF